MAQTNLFGNSVPTLPNLVLEEPTADQWVAITDFLESRSTKNQLLNYAGALAPWLSQYGKVMRTTRNGRVVEATEAMLMSKSNSTKRNIAQGLALVLASEQNLKMYVDSMSQELQELWRTLLFKLFVTQKEAKQILKTTSDLFGQQRSYYYYSDNIVWNKREFGWFTTGNFRSAEVGRYGYRDYEAYITVSPAIHALFLPVFFPETFDQEVGLNNLPEGHYRTINLEADSYAHYQLFCGLYQQGEFPLKKKGVGTADMKRAQKKLSLAEFFPGDTTEFRTNLRAFSYMQLLTLAKQFLIKGGNPTYEQTVRQLLGEFSHLHFWLVGLLYPHIKGLRQQMTEYGRHGKLCNTMFTWLREEPDRWVSIRDIYLKIYGIENGDNTQRFTTLVFHPNDEQSSTQMTNEYTGNTIAANSYAMEFGYTGLQMCAFLLASVGAAEIAINEDKNPGLSPFDSLEFIRLTPLGRYALDLTDEYEAPEQEHVAYFELDPERLIIRSLVEPNPYAQLLMDTSHAISRNRFETSALSFLASCHTKADVESKIKIFRQFISSDLPPLWEQFFKSLLQHCHPLKEDKTAYKRYTLDPENRDLIQLITTDPALRQLVIRAEGYRIMVKNDDLKKFETQLKKHGYLL
ncbi:MAG: hypothetical protein II864_07765 [Prevotella sp.]|nr:hypothetical protein [Prevotella sp.]